MGTQGTLHQRKYPSSSAGVVPERRHKQTDSNTHRQIQTHTETHTPNGHFPSPQAPISCPSMLLPPCRKRSDLCPLPHPMEEFWRFPAHFQVTGPSLERGDWGTQLVSQLGRPETSAQVTKTQRASHV